MLRNLFGRFKEKARSLQSFNAKYYERMEVVEGNGRCWFRLQVTEEICGRNRMLQIGAIAAVADGCTIMELLARFDIKKEVVSVSMNSRVLGRVECGSVVEIHSEVVGYSGRLATIKANVVCDGILVADVQHNVFITHYDLKE